MTKKNLKPQQAAPVQRENTATVVAPDGAMITPSAPASMALAELRDGAWY